MAVKIIYFVHGTTTDNLEHKATGWNPGELSEKGIEQVIQTFKPDQIAIEELFFAKNVKTGIVFLKENETAEKLITDFDSIRKRISEASRNCASESYNAAENHCNLCPFKKGCVKNAGTIQE